MGKLIRAVLRGQDDGNIIPLPDHQANDLKIPAHIRLIAQPAYSPERESTWNMCGKNCAKNT